MLGVSRWASGFPLQLQGTQLGLSQLALNFLSARWKCQAARESSFSGNVLPVKRLTERAPYTILEACAPSWSNSIVFIHPLPSSMCFDHNRISDNIWQSILLLFVAGFTFLGVRSGHAWAALICALCQGLHSAVSLCSKPRGVKGVQTR